jgi:hypothetical protein
VTHTACVSATGTDPEPKGHTRSHTHHAAHWDTHTVTLALDPRHIQNKKKPCASPRLHTLTRLSTGMSSSSSMSPHSRARMATLRATSVPFRSSRGSGSV